ncbi:MAG: hypothetical protein HC902_09880 [Calothrix sp. SM1_5_4]|nr:hypothetical protein [Calothrix sp. SM1_5_4]
MKEKNRGLEDPASAPPERNLSLALDEVGMENVQTQVRVQGLLLPAGRHRPSLWSTMKVAASICLGFTGY